MLDFLFVVINRHAMEMIAARDSRIKLNVMKQIRMSNVALRLGAFHFRLYFSRYVSCSDVGQVHGERTAACCLWICGHAIDVIHCSVIPTRPETLHNRRAAASE